MTRTKKHLQYVGCAYGTKAKGDTVSVDTPLIKSQRPLNTTKVEEYINKSGGINWSIFGSVLAVDMPDGTIKLIDGQHRIACVKTCLPWETQVPAHIVKGTAQQAAQWFLDINGEASQRVNSEHTFKAKCEAGDELYLLLRDQLIKTRFHVGEVNLRTDTRPLSFAGFKKSLRWGDQEFLRACDMVDQVFPKDRDYELLVEALSYVFHFEAYAPLMQSDQGMGKRFIKWLRDLRSVGATPGKMKFKKLYNAGPYSKAVGYGLMKNFLALQRSQGHKVPLVEHIRMDHESHAKSEIEDTFFIYD